MSTEKELPPLPSYPEPAQADPNAETKVLPAVDVKPIPASNMVPMNLNRSATVPVLGPLTPAEYFNATQIVVDTLLNVAPNEIGHILIAGLMSMARTPGPAGRAVTQILAVIAANVNGRGIDYQKYLNGNVGTLERAR